MTTHRNWFYRYAPAVAVMVATAACTGHPARLALLSGEPAKKLAQYPHAQPVLIARAHDQVVAVVFAENRLDIADLLKTLLVAEVKDCPPAGRFGPILCCDPVSHTFFLNGEDHWISTGESCEEQTDAGGEYPDAIEFTSVPADLSDDLEHLFGIDYRFMQLAKEDGAARALVNGPLPSEARLPLPMLDGDSQILLASHKKSTPIGGCVSTITKCPLGGTAYCRKQWNHVYYRAPSGEWCEFPPTCSC